jgi:hypothetical protein
MVVSVGVNAESRTSQRFGDTFGVAADAKRL